MKFVNIGHPFVQSTPVNVVRVGYYCVESTPTKFVRVGFLSLESTLQSRTALFKALG